MASLILVPIAILPFLLVVINFMKYYTLKLVRYGWVNSIAVNSPCPLNCFTFSLSLESHSLGSYGRNIVTQSLQQEYSQRLLICYHWWCSAGKLLVELKKLLCMKFGLHACE